MPHTISTHEQLRAVLGHPSKLVLDKAIDHIDRHCAKFIAASPFVLISTADARGKQDVSPKGDPAGFVKVLDARTLLVPDRPGNRRADTLTNLLENQSIGMLFLIPGVEDSLRVNGRAEISTDPALRELCVMHGKTPALVLRVRVDEAFMHCAKCIKRSDLWRGTARPDGVPSLAEAVRDQAQCEMTIEELQADIDESYRTRLY